MQIESQQEATAPTVRDTLVTATLVGAAFMAGVDLFIVNVAFDDIGRDLAGTTDQASLADLSWVLNAYAVIFAALLVPFGRIADRYGRKRVFLLGLATFGASSLACALAADVWTLVAFRSVQAVGAAAMTPSSLGLLIAARPPERRAAAARLWALTGAIAAAVGPVIGGLLVGLSWHWAFLINLPISVLLIVLAVRAVPDHRDDVDAALPDLLGALCLATAVGALVLAVVQGNEWGWSSSAVLTSFGVAVVAATVFGVRTGRHPAPVIDPRLLRIRAFSIANLATLLFNVAFGASLLGGILWMQQAWQYSALTTGAAIATGPLVVPVTAIAVARLFPTASPRVLVLFGSLAAAFSGVWTGLTLSSEPAYWTTFLPGWVVMGVAVGLVMPNLLAAATAPLPPHQISTGSGVVAMARQIGIVLGVSLLVAVLGGARGDTSAFRSVFWLVAIASLLAAIVAPGITATRATPPRRER